MSSSTCSGNDLKSALECSLCLSLYETPKLLPCCHAFCLKCLERHCDEKSADSDTKFCPVCEHGFTPPEDGLKWLPSDEFLDRLARAKNSSGEATKYCDICSTMSNKTVAIVCCRECRKYLCTNCQGMHNSFMGVTKAHKLWSVDEIAALQEDTDADSVSYCNKHSNKELELYCSECSALICVMCQVVDHQHHTCRMIGDVVKQTRVQLEETKNHMENFATELRQNLQAQTVDGSSITGEIVDAENQIKNRCGDFRAQISSSEEFLLEELSRIKDGDNKETDEKKADMKRLIDRTNGFVKYIEILLDYGKDCEISGTSDRLQKGAKGLIELHSRNSDQDKAEKHVRFIEPPSVAFEKIFQSIGRIEYSETKPKSSNSSADLSGFALIWRNLVHGNERERRLMILWISRILIFGVISVGLLLIAFAFGYASHGNPDVHVPVDPAAVEYDEIFEKNVPETIPSPKLL